MCPQGIRDLFMRKKKYSAPQVKYFTVKINTIEYKWRPNKVKVIVRCSIFGHGTLDLFYGGQGM